MKLYRGTIAIALCLSLCLASMLSGCGKAETEATTPSETSVSSAKQTTVAADIDFPYNVLNDIETVVSDEGKATLPYLEITGVREGLYTLSGYDNESFVFADVRVVYDIAGVMAPGETFALAVPKGYWEDARSVLSASEAFFAVSCALPAAYIFAAPGGDTVSETVVFAEQRLWPVKDGALWLEPVEGTIPVCFGTRSCEAYFLRQTPAAQKAAIQDGDTPDTVKTKLSILLGWCEKYDSYDILKFLCSDIDPDEYVP